MSLKLKCETALFLGTAWVLRRGPLFLAMRVAEQIALVVHRVCGWRRQSTQDRIREVFPELNQAERDRIRLEAVRNLARNVTELVRGPATFTSPIRGEQEVLDRICSAREGGRGVLLIIAHSGNWDLAGPRITSPGYPICYVARQQKNRILYQRLMESRELGGGTVLDRDDPRLLRKLLSFLEEKNGVVTLLVDIRARSPGEAFRFLGRPAFLANGLGLLAGKSGASVLPVYVGRCGREEHFWKPFPLRSLPAGCKDKQQRHELLQSCLDDLSGEILSHPECYFWFNKRWVLEPFNE